MNQPVSQTLPVRYLMEDDGTAAGIVCRYCSTECRAADTEILEPFVDEEEPTTEIPVEWQCDGCGCDLFPDQQDAEE